MSTQTNEGVMENQFFEHPIRNFLYRNPVRHWGLDRADRFPEDFMFKLSKDESEDYRSQFVTSNSDRMGLRFPPYAIISAPGNR
ncbi:MAG: ORF6N domain-containing protein [Lentisphaeria bacterium]|nr:ORF6N domain-containing protein [Lentisphaeria bacterium]